MNLTRISQITFLGATVFAMGLAGCGSDNDDMGASPGQAGSDGAGGTAGSGGSDGSAGAAGSTPMADASLRVVHASPTAPAVDIYPAGAASPLFSNLRYGSASDYVMLPEGTYDLDIRVAGSPASSAPALTIEGVSVAAQKTYTAIAAGDVASSDSADAFRVLALEEGFESADNAVRLRIVHAGYDAPTVDLDVGNDDPSAPEVPGFARFADTGAAGVELPANASLQVGIAAAGNVVTAFTTPELPAGTEAFVIATGRLADAPRAETGFALLAVLSDGTTAWLRQNPFVYALHASPDAPAVDIYAGEAELIDNAGFGDMARLQVPPGAYTLDFFPGMAGATPRPNGAPAASLNTPALESGQTYVAIAGGLLAGTGDQAFQLIPLIEDFSDPAQGEAIVRVVHGSPDAPSVDIGTVTSSGSLDANPPITGVSFAGATAGGGLTLPATDLTIGVAAAGSESTVAEFDVTFSEGARLFTIAAGLLAPSADQPSFQLLVIDASATSILEPWGIAALPANP